MLFLQKYKKSFHHFPLVRIYFIAAALGKLVLYHDSDCTQLLLLAKVFQGLGLLSSCTEHLQTDLSSDDGFKPLPQNC